MPIRVGVLTVSDRCSRDESVDESGPAVVRCLPETEFEVAYLAVVPDDRKRISATMRRWVDKLKCDIVLTTGGTGLSPRDVTPEATKRVIDRDAANLATYLLIESTKRTPFAALGRGVAGIRKSSLIVNLPGSPKGAAEVALILAPLLPHAVAILRGTAESHPTK
jgi:molybdopterin adenylyltransferase